MLQINVNNKTYQLPLLKGETNNWLHLNEDEFDIQLIFEMPSTMVESLYNETNGIQTDENPILVLHLEIHHTIYNFDTDAVETIGDLKINPNFKDLEHLKLSNSINKESTLYFPGYAQRATMTSISFGEIDENEIYIELSGTCIDINGILNFEVSDIKIPVN